MVRDNPKALIWTVPHGASHLRLASALRKAVQQVQPSLTIEITDTLARGVASARLG